MTLVSLLPHKCVCLTLYWWRIQKYETSMTSHPPQILVEPHNLSQSCSRCTYTNTWNGHLIILLFILNNGRQAKKSHTQGVQKALPSDEYLFSAYNPQRFCSILSLCCCTVFLVICKILLCYTMVWNTVQNAPSVYTELY